MIQTGTMPHTPKCRQRAHGPTHTLRAGAGHYVMVLVLLKVYVDHVAGRSPLMHWSSHCQAHPDSITFLCWPKHILQYACRLMETVHYQKSRISYSGGAVGYFWYLLHVHPVIGYSYDFILYILKGFKICNIIYICHMLQADLKLIVGLEWRWIW